MRFLKKFRNLATLNSLGFWHFTPEDFTSADQLTQGSRYVPCMLAMSGGNVQKISHYIFTIRIPYTQSLLYFQMFDWNTSQNRIVCGRRGCCKSSVSENHVERWLQWRSPSYETTAQLNIPSDKSYVHFLSHIRNSLKLAICFQWYFREICKSIDSAKPYNGSCECFCAVFILPDNLGHRHCWHTPADPPRGSNAYV